MRMLRVVLVFSLLAIPARPADKDDVVGFGIVSTITALRLKHFSIRGIHQMPKLCRECSAWALRKV